MQGRKRWWLGLILVLAIWLTPQTMVAAAQSDDSTDFEVKPLFPEEQVDTTLNYFNLAYRKNSTHVIKMQVQNFASKTITVRVNLRNAYTQDGGGIDFTPQTKALDPSLKHPLTTLITLHRGDEKLKLGPKQSRIISATVKLPKERFDGMIYGDWHFVEHPKTPKTKGGMITSNYAYSVGIVLRGQNYQVFPKVKYAKTTPILFNRHPALGVTLRNIAPMAISQANVKVAIGEAGGEVRTFNANNFMIAPNSRIVLPISWSYDALKAGTYQIKVTLKGLNTQNRFPVSWTFNETMKVNNTQAKTINDRAVKKPINYWLYATIICGVLLVLSLGGLVWTFMLRPR
nr:DUF916 and DUF3324 domain-containing protein [Lactobacillus sp. ESL0228]